MKTPAQMRRWIEILFVYTLLVILWGAWVRISHSGDGCGDSWPLCQGELIPGQAVKKTWVEYSHRLMSGFFGIYVFALWWKLRKPAKWVLIFTITEALLGAKLVLFGLVSTNASWGRTLAMSMHQVNSLLLTGSVAWLWVLAVSPRPPVLRARSLLTAILFMVIAVTGAWAALSTTLFPSETLWEGLSKDFSPEAHHLLRLRVMHPLSALLAGGGMAVFFWMKSFEETPARKLHRQTALFFLGAILFGIATLLMLSPVWMKLAHLALAHLLWAAVVRWSASPITTR